MFVSPDEIRARFSAAMSAMYRAEVPAYGTLIELVAGINSSCLAEDPALRASLSATDGVFRLTEERHGAIRLGTSAELALMGRVFAVMGMFPVGYYDLTTAGLPVHSTAFRPVTAAALAANPFRIFTSLLRLDLIADVDLRESARQALELRSILTEGAMALVKKAEAQGGLAEPDAQAFVDEVLETFRWHDHATVSHDLYLRLLSAHRLIADAASFKGPHINHLTPRTLDIDAVQSAMPKQGIAPKEVIEGPPRRKVPILLRQTSFKALEEAVSFQAEDGSWVKATHTARFGEIEQRGVALTRKGRDLYDTCLRQMQNGDTSAFDAIPDDLTELWSQGLCFVEYEVTPSGKRAAEIGQLPQNLDFLVRRGFVAVHPMIYEDFLPISAAGIFRSNLGQGEEGELFSTPQRALFEAALGAKVADEFLLYASAQEESAMRVLQAIPRGCAA